MPCRDARDDEYSRVVYEKGHDPYYKAEADYLKKRCDDLTNLLCLAGRARYNKTNIPKEVIAWWDNHCKLDKSRGEPW
jgi:hypothetical protein